MAQTMELVRGILIPFLGTCLGSACVFLMRGRLHVGVQRVLTGFAAGVMTAASIWSLLVPAMDQSYEMGRLAFVPAFVGFWIGILFLLLLDRLVPHLHQGSDVPEGPRATFKKTTMLLLAVTLHNIPEGMALGVVIAAAMGDAGMSWTAALVFGAGLALQNFPEGMAVVLPLRQSGATQRHCLRWGFWASLAEPAAAIIGILMTTFLATLGGVVMPVLLSVAAGAMIFIVVEELIPESQSGDHGHAATYGFLLGFWLMALLGVLGG